MSRAAGVLPAPRRDGADDQSPAPRLVIRRRRTRTAIACAALLAATAVIALADLAAGDFALSVGEVLGAFVGDDFAHTVVVEWRLPRVTAAIVFGAALGTAGAIFQSLTRNPLASPDIIGFTTGSYTGALLVVLAGGGTMLVATGSLAGGLVTAVVVYTLAFKKGITGFRLIVVGIGISAMLASLNTYLIMVSDHNAALSGAVWGAGTLGQVTWLSAGIGGGAIAALLLLLTGFSRALTLLEMGDDTAAALGVSVEPARRALIVIAVALTAAVTAFAGPIAFIALAAPQVGMRLARSPSVALVPAACTGALLLTASDAIGEHLLPIGLPVGIVTVVIGGGYLVWLLIAQSRR